MQAGKKSNFAKRWYSHKIAGIKKLTQNIPFEKLKLNNLQH